MAALVATAGLGGVLVAIGRMIIHQRYGGWLVWLSAGVGTVLVAVLVGLAIHDTELSTTQQAAVIGVCAYLADDILLGLGALAKLFGSDPLGTLRRIWDAVRGRETRP